MKLTLQQITFVSLIVLSPTLASLAHAQGGVPLWTNRYAGPAKSTDEALAIALDSSGDVFVTGGSDAANGFSDYATIKYSNAGLPLWTNRYNAANNHDSASAIVVDSNGSVFVTGASYAGIGTCCDYATIKYSNDGVPLWTRRYNGPGNSDDWPDAIAVDSTGNVFVTGYSYGANGAIDYATLAYSNAGVPLWTDRYNGAVNDGAYIALDSSGNVFISGASWNGTNYDYVTIKYSSSVPPLASIFNA